MNEPATLDELIDHLVDHRRRNPDHGPYHVEVRERLILRLPKTVTHDDNDKVVMLAGTKHHWGYG